MATAQHSVESQGRNGSPVYLLKKPAGVSTRAAFLVQYRPKVRLRLGYPFLTRHLERERLAQSVRVFEQLIWEITQRRVACVEGEFQVVECGPNVDQVVNKVES